MEIYNKLKKQVTRIYRQRKRERINNAMEKIEHNSRNNLKSMCTNLKKQKWGEQN